MPKISVIIPCHNVEKYVATCLNSVVNQRLEDIEILAIHDHSKDQTWEILKQFEHEYPNKIKAVDMQEKQGVSCARNLGLSLAQGEYIGFVDSDDVISLNMYQDYTRLADQYHADIVAGEFELLSCDAFLNRETFSTNCDFYTLKNYQQDPMQIQGESPAVWNKIYRHSFLFDAKFLENRIFEDIAFLYPLLLKSSNVVRLFSEDYLYRQNTGGIMDLSRKYMNEKILDIFDVCFEAENLGKTYHFDYPQMFALRRKLSHFLLQKIRLVSLWPAFEGKEQLMSELLSLYDWYFGTYERMYGTNVIYQQLKKETSSFLISSSTEASELLDETRKRIRSFKESFPNV